MTGSKSSLIKILVVEDEEIIREFAAENLTDSGFDVLEAADAAEALKLATAAGTVDVLFTDVRLPGDMDGLELAAKLKREGRCRLVIYASGYPYDPPRMVSPSLALRKPYAVDSVVNAIRAMGDSTKADSAATEPAPIL